MIRFGYITAFALVASSCSTILPSDEGTVPEWFETRREQIIAEGYPSLQAAAASQKAQATDAPWAQMAQELDVAQKDIKSSDPGPITITAEQMRAWVAEQKGLVAKGEEPY